MNNTKDDWLEEGGFLIKTFKFADYIQTFSFVSKIALIAEKLRHHPEITFSYDFCTIKLSTNEEGSKITKKDLEFAEFINNL